jgi:hypothetical protein
MASLSWTDDDDRAYERLVAHELGAGVCDVDDDAFWKWDDQDGRVLGFGGALLLAVCVGALLWSLIVWALVALAS